MAGFFTTERRNDTLLIIPQTDFLTLDYQEHEKDVQPLLEAFQDPSLKHAVIDWGNTEAFGSSVLSFLVRLWKRVRTNGGHLALCGVSATQAEVLRLTQFDQFWAVCDSQEQALQTVGQTERD